MSNSVLYDITERKRMDEALRISEERFRVALKNSPVVVFNQDHELRYTWINSPVLAWAVRGYLGQTDAEIVGGEEGARLWWRALSRRGQAAAFRSADSIG
jgi:PAS domain-containing protein